MSDELVVASVNYDTEKQIIHDRGVFVTDFMNRRRMELGSDKFDRQRGKLEKEALKCWELMRDGKLRFYELEEESGRKIVEWKPIEKALRQWLENRMKANDETKEMVERTVEARQRDFIRAQNKIRTRLKSIKDPNADFRERVLNPETRQEAIKKYVLNHRDWRHYTSMALNILFEELERRKK
jgi:hypothetical protein